MWSVESSTYQEEHSSYNDLGPLIGCMGGGDGEDKLNVGRTCVHVCVCVSSGSLGGVYRGWLT